MTDAISPTPAVAQTSGSSAGLRSEIFAAFHDRGEDIREIDPEDGNLALEEHLLVRAYYALAPLEGVEKPQGSLQPSASVPTDQAVQPTTQPVKGEANGLCNRKACQAPLAEEPVHQFMEGNFTGGPRLHYCAKCSRDFDKWDAIDSPGQPNRITRERKPVLTLEAVEEAVIHNLRIRGMRSHGVPCVQDVFNALDEWKAIADREFSARTQVREEATKYKHLLGEMLAIVHRDGGHAVEEHGLDEATKRAIQIVVGMLGLSINPSTCGTEPGAGVVKPKATPPHQAGDVSSQTEGT